MLNNIIVAVLVVLIVVLSEKSIESYLDNFYSPLERRTVNYQIAYNNIFSSLFLLITGLAFLLNVITYWITKK